MMACNDSQAALGLKWRHAFLSAALGLLGVNILVLLHQDAQSAVVQQLAVAQTVSAPHQVIPTAVLPKGPQSMVQAGGPLRTARKSHISQLERQRLFQAEGVAHAAETTSERLDSVLFAFWAFVSAMVTASFMDRNRYGIYREANPQVAMFAASGEKSTVDALSSLLGESPAEEKKAAPAAAAPKAPALPLDEIIKRLEELPLTDAKQQVAFLESLGLPKWGSAVKRLDYYPVTMQQLERVGLTAFSLGIVENDADLDTVKNYTAAVFVIFSVLAVLSGVVFPGSLGASLAYLFGAVPLVFLGIGSVAPGIIIKGISVFEEGKEGKGGNEDTQGINRRVRHEAAHFLIGYLLGLPVCSYNVEDETSRVEFYATARGDLQPGDRFTKQELDKLCVVSLAGTVGEALFFSRAAGGGEDLRILQRAFVVTDERLNPAKQQDQTRWGALKARELLKMYDKEYQQLCAVFAKKLPVKDCIATIESA